MRTRIGTGLRGGSRAPALVISLTGLLSFTTLGHACSNYENSMHWLYGRSFWSYIPGWQDYQGTMDAAKAGNKILVADYPNGLYSFEEIAPGQVELRDVLPGYAWSVDAVGNRAYLARLTEGFSIVNTADLSNLTLMATIAVPYANHVDVEGNYAYVSNSDKLTVIRVQEPGLPSIVAELHVSVSQTIVRGNRAYAISWQGLEVIDVSLPTAPIHLGTAYSNSSLYDLAIEGNELYLVEANYGLRIFDLDDPDQPALVTSVPMSSASSIVIGGARAVVGRSGSFTVLDLQNPIAPVALDTYPGTPSLAGVVENDIAYLASYEFGLQVLDLADGRLPDPVIELPGAASGADLHVEGTRLNLLRPNQLQIYDVSDPASPVSIGALAFTSASCQAVNGDYAYVVANSTFHVVDQSNPSAPVVVGALANVNAQDLVYSGGRIYAGLRWNPTVYILDVTNSTAPSLLGTLNLAFELSAIAVSGTQLYTAENFEGTGFLTVWDASDPTDVVYETQVLSDLVADMAIAGGRLWITTIRSLVSRDLANIFQSEQVSAHNFDGVVAVGSSERIYAGNYRGGYAVFKNPNGPVYIGSGAVQSGITGMAEVADYLYVTDSAGLHIFGPPCMPADAPEAMPSLAGLPMSASPSPFRVETQLRFELPSSGVTRLVVHDAVGRVVRTLRDAAWLPAGSHAVLWDGRDNRGRTVPAGVFFVQLSGPGGSATRRLERLQ